MPQGILRLYLLGALDRQKAERTLTIFAEYRALRGLSRVSLTSQQVNTLVSSIGDLRGYVEGGHTVINLSTLRNVGAALFNILITDRTRDLFLRASGESMGKEEFLPLEIIAEDFEIAGWPWEYLYSLSDERFIAQEFHPVSRSIFSMSSRPSLPAKKGRVRILMILGVPPDDPYTTPEEEVKVIKEMSQDHLGNENFTLSILPASDFRRLQSGFGRDQIDIVHYFGHAGFDHQRGQGFLSISRPGSDPFKIYATDFAHLLMGSGARLVFLNACKTAQASQTDNPGRSSVAATLLDAGIPAVIGTQFSLPDVSAHSLSATVYRTLLAGRPIGEAVRAGRNAMPLADGASFFDWGIPVLYTTNPAQIIFASRSLEAPLLGDPTTGNGEPQAVVVRARSDEGSKTVKVVLLDIDAKVGFLPDLVSLINKTQDYYNFKVEYRPIPSGYVRPDIGNAPQTFLPSLENFLRPLPDELQVDYVCALTEHLIAGETNGRMYWNLFMSSLPGNRVFLESIFDLRRYAREAGIPFANAVLSLCFGMLVACDPRWRIEYHKETVGCLFDFCENRRDIIVGLKKMKFDHELCRAKIRDSAQLEAIDRFFAIKFSEA